MTLRFAGNSNLLYINDLLALFDTQSGISSTSVYVANNKRLCISAPTWWVSRPHSYLEFNTSQVWPTILMFCRQSPLGRYEQSALS